MNLIKTLKPFVKKGNFILSSGIETDIYFDLREAYGDSKILNFIADSVYNQIDKKTTCVAAKGLGSIILAAAIGSRHNLKLTAIRDKRKDYGAQKIIEGYCPTSEDRIAIVEDVFTTGKNLREIIEILKPIKAKNIGCYVVVKRGVKRLREGKTLQLNKLNNRAGLGEGRLDFPLSYLIDLKELSSS